MPPWPFARKAQIIPWARERAKSQKIQNQIFGWASSWISQQQHTSQTQNSRVADLKQSLLGKHLLQSASLPKVQDVESTNLFRKTVLKYCRMVPQSGEQLLLQIFQRTTADDVPHHGRSTPAGKTTRHTLEHVHDSSGLALAGYSIWLNLDFVNILLIAILQWLQRHRSIFRQEI